MIAGSQQATMAFSIALDLFFAVVYPVRYRLFNTKYYFLVLCGTSWTFALFFMVYAWMMMNDDILEFCTVLVAMPPGVVSLWTDLNVIINFGVLGVYLATFLVLKFKCELS
ncbi:hypothetical protein Y032_0087g2055 [Ancylostoma ceylanicum]|nr:hypothetical protein Y032_0087g2055 [Ancylostoma ceylanicum]